MSVWKYKFKALIPDCSQITNHSKQQSSTLLLAAAGLTFVTTTLSTYANTTADEQDISSVEGRIECPSSTTHPSSMRPSPSPPPAELNKQRYKISPSSLLRRHWRSRPKKDVQVARCWRRWTQFGFPSAPRDSMWRSPTKIAKSR